ncbi:hypothetical protein EVAR_79648_1 [Eumeta japonica]|uniref:Uncharacterized protein n=1 Tax=Eumeta variegata TaxID=151549 RepID=A0A4C1WBF9_EUMVA|nr:hypothetical protein EVAR_79648_1 [Eumeta japonica]
MYRMLVNHAPEDDATISTRKLLKTRNTDCSDDRSYQAHQRTIYWQLVRERKADDDTAVGTTRRRAPDGAGGHSCIKQEANGVLLAANRPERCDLSQIAVAPAGPRAAAFSLLIRPPSCGAVQRSKVTLKY